MFGLISKIPNFGNKTAKFISRSISRHVVLHSLPRMVNGAAIHKITTEFGPIVKVRFTESPVNERKLSRLDAHVEFKKLTHAIQFVDEKHRTVLFGNRVEITYKFVEVDENYDDANDEFTNSPTEIRRDTRKFGDKRQTN